MKIVALVLVLALGGCANGFKVFGSVSNPATPTRLAELESVYGVALSAAVAYRNACAQRIIARASCAPIVAKIQAADRKAQIAIRAARVFIRNNPTLDATTVITNAGAAINAFKAVQATYGVN